MMLHCDTISHWLDAYTKWFLLKWSSFPIRQNITVFKSLWIYYSSFFNLQWQKIKATCHNNFIFFVNYVIFSGFFSIHSAQIKMVDILQMPFSNAFLSMKLNVDANFNEESNWWQVSTDLWNAFTPIRQQSRTNIDPVYWSIFASCGSSGIKTKDISHGH